MVRHAQMTTRLLSRKNGIMAVSPRRPSQTKNMMMITTAPHSKPMTFAELQAYVTPPHSTANSSITHPGAKSAKPGKSRRSKVCNGVGLSAMTSLAFGTWMKVSRVAVMPPICSGSISYCLLFASAPELSQSEESVLYLSD